MRANELPGKYDTMYRVVQIIAADVDAKDDLLGAHGYISDIRGESALVRVRSMYADRWFPLASLEVLI